MTIGVIISTYNNPAWLEKTLWGYMCQLRAADEIIIADDGSKELRKYRIAAFAAPALSLTIFLTSICFSDIILPIKILAGAATVFIMPASYFNLKHFLLPDVDLGIIKCLKSYNLLVLIFCFLSEAEMIALIYKIWDLEWLIAAAMGIVILGIVPSVKKGMDKWTS